MSKTAFGSQLERLVATGAGIHPKMGSRGISQRVLVFTDENSARATLLLSEMGLRMTQFERDLIREWAA